MSGEWTTHYVGLMKEISFDKEWVESCEHSDDDFVADDDFDFFDDLDDEVPF